MSAGAGEVEGQGGEERGGQGDEGRGGQGDKGITVGGASLFGFFGEAGSPSRSVSAGEEAAQVSGGEAVVASPAVPGSGPASASLWEVMEASREGDREQETGDSGGAL